tara:strand:- start:226 stop:501 length:276 start_codon:yes stop_codon:yes gene_type:complete
MKVTQLRGHTSYIDDQPSSAAIPNLKNAGFLANFHDQIAIANRMQHKHVTIGVIQNTGLAVYRDYVHTSHRPVHRLRCKRSNRHSIHYQNN